MDELTLRRLLEQLDPEQQNEFLNQLDELDQNANPELSNEGLFSEQDTATMNKNMGMLTSPDEFINPLYQLNKLFSPLNGLDSLPDVAYNTDWKNPLSVASAPLRYAGNVISGVAGWIPGVDAPEFKGVSDLMEQSNFTTGNEGLDLGVGIAGDIFSSPSTYLGPGVLKGLLKGAGKGAKTAVKATKTVGKAANATKKLSKTQLMSNLFKERNGLDKISKRVSKLTPEKKNKLLLKLYKERNPLSN